MFGLPFGFMAAAAAPSGSDHGLYSSQTPATNTPGSFELGTNFTCDSNGTLIKVRFNKHASETGTHTARVWTAGGSLVTSEVFTGETSSGWQEVTLSSPVSVTSGTHYIVSVNLNAQAYYEVTGFPLDNGIMHADANGGVFNASVATFPGPVTPNAHYWIDPIVHTVP